MLAIMRSDLDVLYVRARPTGTNAGRDRVGDLKLFEPKTMCPLTAVRDREER